VVVPVLVIAAQLGVSFRGFNDDLPGLVEKVKKRDVSGDDAEQ
jgi:hypothetical protein